jgi:hypothetical protein
MTPTREFIGIAIVTALLILAFVSWWAVLPGDPGGDVLARYEEAGR